MKTINLKKYSRSDLEEFFKTEEAQAAICQAVKRAMKSNRDKTAVSQ